jgi:hypothetical protein
MSDNTSEQSLVPPEGLLWRVNAEASQLTKKFVKQQTLVMGTLSAISAVVVQHFLGASVFSWPTLLASIIVFLGTIVLTYFVNFLRAPFIIDKRLRRDIGMLLKEWERHMNIVDELYDARVEGARLLEICGSNRDRSALEHLINNWHPTVANWLYAIGKEYREEFYKDNKDRYVPDLPDDASHWEQWIKDRNKKIDKIIKEFERPPQLASHKAANQLESGATQGF